MPPGGSVTFADRTGTIIARQPNPEQFVGTKIPANFMRLVNAAEPGVEEVASQDGTYRMLGYVPTTQPPKGIYISAGLSTEASYGAVRRAIWDGAILALAAALATLAATWFAGRYFFVQPLRKVSTALQLWRRGDRSARTHADPSTGEIGALGSQIDDMMEEIATQQDQRDLLAGELAHRVKNTFATIQAIATSRSTSLTPLRTLFLFFWRAFQP